MRKNDDLISRQDALSFLRNWERVKDYSWGERNIIKATINEIESLPSAQPEIIRCKDCKWCEDADGLMCKNTASWVVATDYDFGCVLAERRQDG